MQFYILPKLSVILAMTKSCKIQMAVSFWRPRKTSWNEIKFTVDYKPDHKSTSSPILFLSESPNHGNGVMLVSLVLTGTTDASLPGPEMQPPPTSSAENYWSVQRGSQHREEPHAQWLSLWRQALGDTLRGGFVQTKSQITNEGSSYKGDGHLSSWLLTTWGISPNPQMSASLWNGSITDKPGIQ